MVFALTPITRPLWRCLTICRYCQPSWGCFLVGGRPLPLYSGTFPHTSTTIASSYPPHPSQINGGGECSCPLLFFSCSNASQWQPPSRSLQAAHAPRPQSSVTFDQRTAPELSTIRALL